MKVGKVAKARSSACDTIGHDAFLDVVCNLVGILVILIMVIGVRTRNARQYAQALPPSTAQVGVDQQTGEGPEPGGDGATEEVMRSVEAARAKVRDLTRDTYELDRRIAELSEETARQQLVRNQLQLLVSLAEKSITPRRDQLQAEDRERSETDRRLAEAHQELDRLNRAIHTLDGIGQQPQILEHRPTPLAKTVFGREEHFRLLGGRLAYVPLNELVDQMRSDAKSKLWKLQKADQITETIGPIGGFRMRYTMQRFERPVQTSTGPALRRTVELVRFTLFPMADDLGEPLDRALTEGSEFMRRIAQLNSNDTTVTVWTYPDSYPEFRALKEVLQKSGFVAAARPLPEGYPIAGAPDGSRSAAE
jgi:hypothetical protein